MHYTTRRFWEYYNALPEEVQQTADQCYELLKVDPSHPSLHFKKVGNYYIFLTTSSFSMLQPDD